MKKSNVLILILITAVVAGAYFYSSRKDIKIDGTGVDMQNYEPNSTDKKVQPAQMQAHSASKTFESNTKNALALLSTSKSASDIMPIIWPLAIEGNADAIVATFEIMSRCGQFYGDDRFKPKNSSDPTSPTYALREAAIKRNATYCNDAGTHKMASAERKILRDQLKLAALKGDEIALAYELSVDNPNPESIVTAKRLANESKEPWVVEQALIAMSLNADAESQSIDAKIFSTATDTHEQKLKIKQYAAKWKACSIGADCAPNNAFLDSMCMHEGNCYSHLNTKDFIKQRVLSQSEYEKMLQYLESIGQQ